MQHLGQPQQPPHGHRLFVDGGELHGRVGVKETGENREMGDEELLGSRQTSRGGVRASNHVKADEDSDFLRHIADRTIGWSLLGGNGLGRRRPVLGTSMNGRRFHLGLTGTDWNRKRHRSW